MESCGFCEGTCWICGVLIIGTQKLKMCKFGDVNFEKRKTGCVVTDIILITVIDKRLGPDPDKRLL